MVTLTFEYIHIKLINFKFVLYFFINIYSINNILKPNWICVYISIIAVVSVALASKIIKSIFKFVIPLVMMILVRMMIFKISKVLADSISKVLIDFVSKVLPKLVAIVLIDFVSKVLAKLSKVLILVSKVLAYLVCKVLPSVAKRPQMSIDVMIESWVLLEDGDCWGFIVGGVKSVATYIYSVEDYQCENKRENCKDN